VIVPHRDPPLNADKAPVAIQRFVTGLMAEERRTPVENVGFDGKRNKNEYSE